MSQNKIPTEVQKFIFEHIDSAEQLEILLLLRQFDQREWTVGAISQELRTSEESVRLRLKLLLPLGLIAASKVTPMVYRYQPESEDLSGLINKLAESYKSHRHTIYELIFSPLKRARTFADAFRVKKDGGDHG